MLYVEHPIGTGFSYGHPYPENERQASGDLDAFLQNFFAVFQDLATADFYVVGESYAGMFVPAVSRYFHRANQKALKEGDTKRIPIHLKGAALGNGWIDVSLLHLTGLPYAIAGNIRYSLFFWRTCRNNKTNSPRSKDPRRLTTLGGMV